MFSRKNTQKQKIGRTTYRILFSSISRFELRKMYIPDGTDRFVSKGDGSVGCPVYDIFRIQVTTEKYAKVVNANF